mmetsp:Transcript_13910/g.25636  ORF Transcript_13910/g.25636 Transcript_13910/m.25636 type:complete len:119 (-) Transcript_13910:716-1072(-)
MTASSPPEEHDPGEKEVKKVAPAEDNMKSGEGEVKATEVKKEAARAATVTTPAEKDAPLHVLVIMGILIALLGTFAQQTDLISGNKSPERWCRELFEPHVVPPPDAETNQVVIQFCQS